MRSSRLVPLRNLWPVTRTQRNSTRGPFMGSMDPFLGQQTSESRLPRLPRAIFDSRPARLVSRGEDAGDADPEHDVSCALAVHRQKTKVACVSRWTAISEQRDTIVRRPPSAHGPVRGGAPFCLLSSTKGGQFLRAASRLADSHSGSAQFRIGRLGSATIGNRAALQERGRR